jgi:hypothetical protein
MHLRNWLAPCISWVVLLSLGEVNGGELLFSAGYSVKRIDGASERSGRDFDITAQRVAGVEVLRYG